jgi:HEAT repeat protein
MRGFLAVFALTVPFAAGLAQEVRPKDVRDIAKDGAASIPKLATMVKNSNREVRLETVRQLTAIGTQASIDPLVEATRDNDPEIQLRAADGLVNFYYPGYVQSGIIGAFKRAASNITGRFGEGDNETIDPYVVVRAEVVSALGRLATGGGGAETRASAARGLGILRGKGAIRELVEAAHSKDTEVIFESLRAIQKIRDISAGPLVEFRLRDLDQRVQIAAIETVGLLRDKGALPVLTDVLKRSGSVKVRRAALTAVAMLPDEANRPLFTQFLADKDEDLRAAAAEGFGRLHSAEDIPMLDKAFGSEGKPAPRLSLAFALAMNGRLTPGGLGPMDYLVDSLNSSARSGQALPLLIELAREEKVRDVLYAQLPQATKDEKIGLARVFGASGDQRSVAELKKLSEDKDAAVAQEGLRALRAVQSRL